ncbi:MAG: TolC family protein, partial [Candidatus Omnitrophota bacterium]
EVENLKDVIKVESSKPKIVDTKLEPKEKKTISVPEIPATKTDTKKTQKIARAEKPRVKEVAPAPAKKSKKEVENLKDVIKVESSKPKIVDTKLEPKEKKTISVPEIPATKTDTKKAQKIAKVEKPRVKKVAPAPAKKSKKEEENLKNIKRELSKKEEAYSSEREEIQEERKTLEKERKDTEEQINKDIASIRAEKANLKKRPMVIDSHTRTITLDEAFSYSKRSADAEMRKDEISIREVVAKRMRRLYYPDVVASVGGLSEGIFARIDAGWWLWHPSRKVMREIAGVQVEKAELENTLYKLRLLFGLMRATGLYEIAMEEESAARILYENSLEILEQTLEQFKKGYITYSELTNIQQKGKETHIRYLESQQRTRNALELFKSLAGYDVSENISIDVETAMAYFTKELEQVEDRDRYTRILLKALGIKEEALDTIFSKEDSKVKIRLFARAALGWGALVDADLGLGFAVTLRKKIDQKIQKLDEKLAKGAFVQELRNMYLESSHLLQQLRLIYSVLPNLENIAINEKMVADESRLQVEKNVISQDDYLKDVTDARQALTRIAHFKALAEETKSRLRELGIEEDDIPAGLTDENIHNASLKMIKHKSWEAFLYLKQLGITDETVEEIAADVDKIAEEDFLYREATDSWALEKIAIWQEIQKRICAEIILQNKGLLLKRLHAISAGYGEAEKAKGIDYKVSRKGALYPASPLTPEQQEAREELEQKESKYMVEKTKEYKRYVKDYGARTSFTGIVLRLKDSAVKAKLKYRKTLELMFGEHEKAEKIQQVNEAEEAKFTLKMLREQEKLAEEKLRLATELKELLKEAYDDKTVEIDVKESEVSDGKNEELKAANDIANLKKKIAAHEAEYAIKEILMKDEKDYSAQIKKLFRWTQAWDYILEIAEYGEPYDISLTGEYNQKEKTWKIGLQLPLPIWRTTKFGAKRINIEQAKQDLELAVDQSAHTIIEWINDAIRNAESVKRAEEKVELVKEDIRYLEDERDSLKAKHAEQQMIIRTEMDIISARKGLVEAEAELKKTKTLEKQSQKILEALRRLAESPGEGMEDSEAVTLLREFAKQALESYDTKAEVKYYTWDSFKKRAKEKDINVKMAKSEAEKARLQVRKEKWQARAPEISLVLNHENFDSINKEIAALNRKTGYDIHKIGNTWRYGGGFYAEPTKWFGKTNATLKIAEFEKQVRGLDVETAMLNNRLLVNELYYSYIMAQKKAAILEGYLDAQNRYKEEIEFITEARMEPDKEKSIGRYALLIQDTEKKLKDIRIEIAGLKFQIMTLLQEVGDIDFKDEDGKLIDLALIENDLINFEKIWKDVEKSHPDINALKKRVDKEELGAKRAKWDQNWWIGWTGHLFDKSWDKATGKFIKKLDKVTSFVMNIRLNLGWYESKAEKLRAKKVKEELLKRISDLRRKVYNMLDERVRLAEEAEVAGSVYVTRKKMVEEARKEYADNKITIDELRKREYQFFDANENLSSIITKLYTVDAWIKETMGKSGIERAPDSAARDQKSEIHTEERIAAEIQEQRKKQISLEKRDRLIREKLERTQKALKILEEKGITPEEDLGQRLKTKQDELMLVKRDPVLLESAKYIPKDKIDIVASLFMPEPLSIDTDEAGKLVRETIERYRLSHDMTEAETLIY